MKIVVVGCTHAGTAAVVNLKELHPESEITVYEKNDNLSFLSCGIALNVGGVIKETKNLFYNSTENLAKIGVITNMKHEVLDIDFENNIIHIKHSVYDKPKDEKGRWYIGSTKTISGTRDVFMSPTLSNALRNFKKRQDWLKEIYGNKYIYYHIEDVKNEFGKVIETRIVENKIGEEYENNIDLILQEMMVLILELI